MKPSGIHHVAICVSDAASGLAFYRDVMGFTERTDRPDFGFPGHWLEAGGQQLHLMEMDAAAQPMNHFAIRVDDLGEAVADLRAHGVTVNTVDHMPGAGYQAFLNDPFGNSIELNQPDH